MIQLATPISHLFENAEEASIIQQHSDCLECRDRSLNSNSPKQYLFHCELQLIHQWTDVEHKHLKTIHQLKPDLKLISLHIASVCDKPVTVERIFQLGGKTYTEEEMHNCAKENISFVKKLFGSNVKIAVENNNYYPTPAYDIVTEANFIADVVHRNDIHFLFDIAHAKVTCHNKNISFKSYKSALPLDKAIQIHICSFAINHETNVAFDAHDIPNDEELAETALIISDYPSVEYLTVEYYRDIKNLTLSLQKVRQLL